MPADTSNDGTSQLCRALYGRDAQPADYLGGANAAMLYDAVKVITDLRAAVRDHEECVGELEYATELARARAILGPDCPKCGHYLKAEHWNSRITPLEMTCLHREAEGTASFGCQCLLRASDLLTNHPEIAKELGLTKETKDES